MPWKFDLSEDWLFYRATGSITARFGWKVINHEAHEDVLYQAFLSEP